MDRSHKGIVVVEEDRQIRLFPGFDRSHFPLQTRPRANRLCPFQEPFRGMTVRVLVTPFAESGELHRLKAV